MQFEYHFLSFCIGDDVNIYYIFNHLSWKRELGLTYQILSLPRSDSPQNTSNPFWTSHAWQGSHIHHTSICIHHLPRVVIYEGWQREEWWVTFWILDPRYQIALCKWANKFVYTAVPEARYLCDEDSWNYFVIFRSHLYLCSARLVSRFPIDISDGLHRCQDSKLIGRNISKISCIELHDG